MFSYPILLKMKRKIGNIFITLYLIKYLLYAKHIIHEKFIQFKNYLSLRETTVTNNCLKNIIAKSSSSSKQIYVHYDGRINFSRRHYQKGALGYITFINLKSKAMILISLFLVRISGLRYWLVSIRKDINF